MGVYECSPSSVNAVACLKSTDQTLLCLFSTDNHLLTRVRPVGALPTTTSSLGVVLTSGQRCNAYYNGTNPTAGRLAGS